jgi:hypothetical protein
MRVISWNVKSFASAVNLGGNAFTIIQQVVTDFDVVAFYEVPNSPNAEAHDGTPLTGLVMGDFNAMLTVGRRGRGRNLARQLPPGVPNGTTLTPGQQGVAPASTVWYRTANTYDQFYAEGTLIQPAGPVGVYDVMNKRVNDQVPFTGLFGNVYNTPKKA